MRSIEGIKPEGIRNHVLLLDIDGVVCEPQTPITEDMAQKINLIHYVTKGRVYYVTGNTYTKAVDLVGGGKIFCNGGDELREDGRLLWRDEVTPPLPEKMGEYLSKEIANNWLTSGNNSIEWRCPRFVNLCPIGRFATKEQRNGHSNQWCDGFAVEFAERWPEADMAIGGQVSVDIYSKGADKSRAAKYINETLKRPFIFIGDKTSPGGNDYPIIEYSMRTQENNICLTTDGPRKTIDMLDKIFGMIR